MRQNTVISKHMEDIAIDLIHHIALQEDMTMYRATACDWLRGYYQILKEKPPCSS